VSEVHEIIELGPVADLCRPHGAGIDGGIGTDLDVITNHHAA
jgi:hypothetical protein